MADFSGDSMFRQHGYALAAALSLCLAGCAAIGDLTVAADPELASLALRLDTDAWHVDPAWSPETQAFRWRLGDVSLSEQENRQLAALVTRRDQAGVNAAILLARHAAPADASLSDRLRRIVVAEDEPIPELSRLFEHLREAAVRPGADPLETTRAAAAEAWCRILAAGEGPPEDSLAEPGRLWRQPDLPDLARAELLRGLARHIAPERIEGCADLFRRDGSNASDELRHAVIDGCILFAAGRPDAPFASDDWPATIENAGLDPDPAVRAGYGRWLATARHPEAVARLGSQTNDSELSVVREAVRSLGLLKSDDARDALRRLACRPAETMRVAAVEALAGWGAVEVRSYLSDASPHVRRAAVSGLARSPGLDSAIFLQEALVDQDLEVQRRAVQATAAWSDEQALPILLEGLQHAAVRTRGECLDELRRRTGFDGTFPVAADPQERSAALRALAQEQGWPLDRLTRHRFAESGGQSSPPVPPPVIVKDLLRQVADSNPDTSSLTALCERLRAAGPSAVRAIEEFCLANIGPAAEVIVREVLPALSPAHEALAELGLQDVAARRSAAGRLAEASRAATLSPFVLRRLHVLLTREQDGLVWRQVIAAIMEDGTSDAERIALLALNNPWPDVRRLGCEYVGRHCRAHQALWLMPLLADGNDAVRLAAIEAAGRCGNTALIGSADATPPTGLRGAAADPDRAVRFAALAALARLGDEFGSQGLARWAEYEAPADRAEAIRAIARTGLRRFEPILVRLLWTERDQSIRRELLAALEAIVPAGQRPDGSDALLPEERVHAWVRRWEAAEGFSTMAPPLTPAPPGRLAQGEAG